MHKAHSKYCRAIAIAGLVALAVGSVGCVEGNPAAVPSNPPNAIRIWYY